MERTKVFVVEDDPMYLKILNHQLSMDPNFEVHCFPNALECIRNISMSPSVITLDHQLPDMTGLEALKKIKSISPNTEVIVLSGQEDIETAISFMQNGAYDYIPKNAESLKKLWLLVHRAIEKQQLKEDIAHLTQEISNKFNFSKYIKGTSEPIQRIFQILEKTAKTNITVSITGETGTGKELIAKAVHFNSNRFNRPFVAINVAAIPKELVESELFGSEKGAFTGSTNTKIGKFEEANKGTLFLDEIAEMDLLTQSKLLRALQEREISRLGSSKTIPIDVRIIIATHKDLQEEVKAGRFREDLYYRLMGVKVDLPPLRERRSDILLLAKHFLNEFTKENQLPPKKISKAAQEKLSNYAFPGNVRELKAVIEIAAVMCDQETIEPENLSLYYTGNIGVNHHLDTSLEGYTLQIISSYLEKYNHNVVQVAEKLQIGKSTIYRFIKEGKINAR